MGFADSFKEYTSGDLINNIWQSQVWGTLLWWFELLLAVGVVSAILAFVYKKYLPYKIKVTVWRQLGQGLECKNDRAKEVTDTQGKTKLQLMKFRDGKKFCTLPLPESKFRHKMGKNDHYNLWMDDNKQFHPVEFFRAEGAKLLKVRPKERDAWARYEDKRLFEIFMKKEKWEKWLPGAIFIAAIFGAVLIWFFMVKDLSAGMGSTADAFRQVASSCTKLG